VLRFRAMRSPNLLVPNLLVPNLLVIVT